MYYGISDEDCKILDALVSSGSIREYKKTIYGVEILFNGCVEAIEFSANADRSGDPVLEIEYKDYSKE